MLDRKIRWLPPESDPSMKRVQRQVAGARLPEVRNSIQLQGCFDALAPLGISGRSLDKAEADGAPKSGEGGKKDVEASTAEGG